MCRCNLLLPGSGGGQVSGFRAKSACKATAHFHRLSGLRQRHFPPFPRGFPGWVRVRLTDGRLLEARAPDGRGSVSRPLPAAAIVDKFRDNAGRALAPARIGEIERAVLALDTLADVRSLAALCRA